MRYWSCLKNAADKARVRWYSCGLVRSHRHIAVPGQDMSVVEPQGSRLVKPVGFPNLQQCVWDGVGGR